MVAILLTVIVALLQSEPPPRPPTVLLISLDAKTDKDTQDFKKAFPLTTLEDGIVFDLDGDGRLEQVAWTRPDSPIAFLALDQDGNGVIDNGKELIGNRIVDGADSGVRALSKLPQDPNDSPGWIDYHDPVYSKLLLWTDANHNGICERNELRLASEVVTRIGLGNGVFNRTDDHGNLVKYQGWVEMRTAAGPNEVSGGEEHFRRVRRMYEVALKTK